jgi:hypothetical protein
MIVAPLTASMSALCFVSALWRGSGSAELLICTDLGSLPCSWRASILVILPFETVTRSCASPYRVWIASPVAVLVAELVPEEDDADDGDVPLLAAVAAGSAGSRALKLRGEGADRRDPDPCADEEDGVALPRVRGERAVGPLDGDARARRHRAEPRAVVGRPGPSP